MIRQNNIFIKNKLPFKLKTKNSLILSRSIGESEPYFKLASEFDYNIFIITVENYHDNKKHSQYQR